MRERTKGSQIIFEERVFILPGVFIAAGVILALLALGIIKSGDFTGDEIVWPALGGAVFMIAGGAVFLETSSFAFDKLYKRLTWSTWSLRKRASGAVPFADILSVNLQSISDSDGSTYRVVLHTANGLLPMTRAYSGTLQHWDAIAERIRAIIGPRTLPEDDDIRALIREGRIVDAVRQLREAKGVDLITAKTEIDRLRGEMGV